MNLGKLAFIAQLTEHLPLTTFRVYVGRYRGEFKVKSFSCLDQFPGTVFAQVTYRKTLRDIEACRRAQIRTQMRLPQQDNCIYSFNVRTLLGRNDIWP